MIRRERIRRRMKKRRRRRERERPYSEKRNKIEETILQLGRRKREG